MKNSAETRRFHELRDERVRLEMRIKSIDEHMGKLVPKISLEDAVWFFHGVQAHTVWEKEDLCVVLLVNKNRFGGCGVLLWGCQFENKSIPELALKIDQFEAKFMVFDGQPGSHDFAMLGHASNDEGKKQMFENLRRICSSENINYVYLKNAKVLSEKTKICPGKEFREMSEFYMMIARRDGSIIPEFNFINSQNSSAFWSNW